MAHRREQGTDFSWRVVLLVAFAALLALVSQLNQSRQFSPAKSALPTAHIQADTARPQVGPD